MFESQVAPPIVSADLTGQTKTPRSSHQAAMFATVEAALQDIALGRMVVVVDDADRENEGDVVMAAEFVTAADINFMLKYARGYVCVALTSERCDELGLSLQADEAWSDLRRTPFTMTIDARNGVTTGVSSADRARTIQVAIDEHSGTDDIVVGGHINPLRARAGGVLERDGHTEASVDLARLAGCAPGGVLCEILNENGTMARLPQLLDYCTLHDLKLITIADLIEYRRVGKDGVTHLGETQLPTRFGSRYLQNKKERMGHSLTQQSAAVPSSAGNS